MTLPVAVLGGAKLAVSLASAGGGLFSAIQGNKQQGELYEQNAQAANDAYVLQTHMRNKQVLDQQDATSQKKQDNSIKRLQASATGLAAAAAGGTQGASVEQILDDFRRSEGIVADRIDQNLESAQAQARFDLLGLSSQAQSRINSIPLPDPTNVYAAAIRGAGVAFEGISDFKDLYDGDFKVG